MSLITTTPESRLLYLITSIGPGCSRTSLDAELLDEGIKAGICRIVTPHAKGDPQVYLTALGIERSLELQKSGHLLIGVDITRHGLTIARDLDLEQWRSLIERLRLVKECYHTALSDGLRYGRARFGDDIVNQTIEQLQFPFMDIAHAESIAAVPRVLRERCGLTSEHYYILGLHFPTDNTSQEMWAQRAVEHGLSPLALKRSIEAGTILTDDALKQRIGSGSGIPVLQGLALPFSRWLHHAGGVHKIEAMPHATRVAILDELRPIVDFALELREKTFPED